MDYVQFLSQVITQEMLRVGIGLIKDSDYGWHKHFSPSLSQHIGDTSTIWSEGNRAAGKRAASDFVGEDYNLQENMRLKNAGI